MNWAYFLPAGDGSKLENLLSLRAGDENSFLVCELKNGECIQAKKQKNGLYYVELIFPGGGQFDGNRIFGLGDALPYTAFRLFEFALKRQRVQDIPLNMFSEVRK